MIIFDRPTSMMYYDTTEEFQNSLIELTNLGIKDAMLMSVMRIKKRYFFTYLKRKTGDAEGDIQTYIFSIEKIVKEPDGLKKFGAVVDFTSLEPLYSISFYDYYSKFDQCEKEIIRDLINLTLYTK